MRRWVALAAVLAHDRAGRAPRAHRRGPLRRAGRLVHRRPADPTPARQPFACLRSDHNYPSLVARTLRPAKFTDVSCSAATIADMTRPQQVLLGHNIPQLDAVTPDTTLVTIGIGGNDLGFSKTVYTCAGLSLSAPKGAPVPQALRRAARPAGRRRRSPDRGRAPRRARAGPQARVLVVGYLGCCPPPSDAGPGCRPGRPATCPSSTMSSGR